MDRNTTHKKVRIATGADFDRAMVATAPGEKLLTGRRLLRSWTRRTISSLILCRKLHLFLGKSTKTAATRAALFDSNMHLIVCWLGLREKGSGKGERREFVLCPRKKKSAPMQSIS